MQAQQNVRYISHNILCTLPVVYIGDTAMLYHIIHIKYAVFAIAVVTFYSNCQ